MSAQLMNGVLYAAARDWHGWLRSRGLTDPSAMTAYRMADLAAGAGPLPRVARVYCALTTAGEPCYVGQTRRQLARRVAEHVWCGNATCWAYIVTVAVPSATKVHLDMLERSAGVWMVPSRQRHGRKLPTLE
jgi:hypothetical protein